MGMFSPKTPGCITQKHPGVLPKNIRVYYPKTSGCFNGKDADVMTSQYTGQTGSVLMGEALSPYTSRVH